VREAVTIEPHIPVLLAETINALAPRPGARLIDCTVNGGGHSAAILERTEPNGQLLALDADPQACTVARARFHEHGERVHVVQSNFRHVGRVAADAGFVEVDAILMDLGFSSRQMDAPERGFAFSMDGPLDMRFDPTTGLSAAEFLAAASQQDIERALREYGEEPRARSIAMTIVRRRERDAFQTTGELAETVARATGGRQGRTHPATRTFQALRILVNDELGALEDALPQCVALLKRGGRLAVISFHSLEDRIVKSFFREESGGAVPDAPRHLPVAPPTRPAALRIVTRRPVRPSQEEIARNPRSRSAKLRVAERI
jgi:16S rRNA (cytosine1402-N4)-methyltransferase